MFDASFIYIYIYRQVPGDCMTHNIGARKKEGKADETREIMSINSYEGLENFSVSTRLSRRKISILVLDVSSLISARRDIIFWCKFLQISRIKCSGDVEKICDNGKIIWTEYVSNINRISNIDWSLSKATALRNAATRRIIVVNDIDKFVNRTSFLFVARKMKIILTKVNQVALK